jgi:hypothetical protein
MLNVVNLRINMFMIYGSWIDMVNISILLSFIKYFFNFD